MIVFITVEVFQLITYDVYPLCVCVCVCLYIYIYNVPVSLLFVVSGQPANTPISPQ